MSQRGAALSRDEAERLVEYVAAIRGESLTTDQVATVLNWALLVRAQTRRLDAILRQPTARAMAPG